MTTSIPASPKMMGPYQILEPIGTGGMATVVKAYQPRLDRYVAIKMLHAMFLSDQGFLARFEREGRVVASLNHPNIIPLYDYDQDTETKQPYLVMRLIEGQSLKERLVREGPPPLNATLLIISAIASALTYAHSRGVLHRDVKPSNIILSEDQTPYLMDFGLARMIKAGESTMSADMMIGTPHYISPEQAQGSLVLDARTDVYSLGVVLYELVVGRLPFNGDTPFIIVHKHIYEAPTPPREIMPDLPPAVEAVLLKALNKNPEDRYATPDELAASFREAVQQTGLSSLPVERVRPPEDTAEAFPAVSAVSSAVPSANSYAPTADRPGSDPSVSHTGRGQQRQVQIPQLESTGNTAKVPLFSQHSLQESVNRMREAVYDIRHTLRDRERLRGLHETGEHAYVQIRSQVEQLVDENGEISWRRPGDAAASDSQKRRRRTRHKRIAREWGTDERSVRARIESQISERRGLAIHVSIYALIVGLVTTFTPQIQMFIGEIFSESSPMFPISLLPFGLVLAFAWGGGVLAHLLDVLYKTGSSAQRRRHAIASAMQRRFGDHWTEIATDREYRSVRKQAVRTFEERLNFLQHLVVTICIIGVVFVANTQLRALFDGMFGEAPFKGILTSPQFPFIAALVMLIPVVIHGVIVGLSPLMGEAAKARAIEREYANERQETGSDPLSEKEKHTHVRLTEDGELTESMVHSLHNEWLDDADMSRPAHDNR